MTEMKLLLKKVSDGKTVELSGEVLVGRTPPAALILTEGQPSRQHAMLAVGADGATVEDLKSTNGTFVNGRRIAGKVPLNDGDRVRFDVEEFQFLVQRPVDPDKTMMRPSASAEPARAEVPPKGSAPPSDGAAGNPQPVPAGSGQPPGGWVNRKGDKTEFIDPKNLKDIPALAQAPPVAGTDDAPYLIVCSGASNGMKIRLARSVEGQQEWTVGSDPGRDIRLGDSGVSGLHARIVHEGARWKVEDVMSANGTFVNGKRSPVSYLASGDRIRFGRVDCLLQLPRSRVAAARTPAVQGTSWRKTTIVVTASFILTAVLLIVVFLLLK